MDNVRSAGDDAQVAERPLAWKTRDVVVAAALAVPLGLVWSLVWGQVWTFARALSPELGFFVAGFYVAAGVIVGYVVRRPGAALLGGAILGGLCSKLIADALVPTGVLNNFPIARNRVREI